MCSFIASITNKGSLGRDVPSMLFYDPSAHVQVVSRSGPTVKSYSEFCRKSLPIAADDCLRHGFIQDGANDSAVYRAPKALPLQGWCPLC